MQSLSQNWQAAVSTERLWAKSFIKYKHLRKWSDNWDINLSLLSMSNFLKISLMGQKRHWIINSVTQFSSFPYFSGNSFVFIAWCHRFNFRNNRQTTEFTNRRVYSPRAAYGLQQQNRGKWANRGNIMEKQWKIVRQVQRGKWNTRIFRQFEWETCLWEERSLSQIESKEKGGRGGKTFMALDGKKYEW